MNSLWLFLIALVLLVAWLATLVQLLKRTDLDGTTKVCWVIVLCTLTLLGLVLYGIWGPKQPEAKPFRRLFEPPNSKGSSTKGSP